MDKQSKTLKGCEYVLKEERYDKILAILEEEQYISAQKLSASLYVSLPTIRRDNGDYKRDSFGVFTGKKKESRLTAPLARSLEIPWPISEASLRIFFVGLILIKCFFLATV